MGTEFSRHASKAAMILLALGIVALTGCASSGSFKGQSTDTGVKLEKNNCTDSQCTYSNVFEPSHQVMQMR